MMTVRQRIFIAVVFLCGLFSITSPAADVAGSGLSADGPVLDVTQPPFNADPTGQHDCTEAINRALDWVLSKTLNELARTVEAVEALPGDNGRLEPSCENRKQNGKVIVVLPRHRPYAPTLYFPPGIYRVSDTLTYSLKNLKNSLGTEVCWQIRMRGAGMDQSVIQLENHAPGFDGPNPKAVVQFNRSGGSNMGMSNYFEELTVDTGKENPSAVGVDFFANNSGAVRNVRVRSGDGQGRAGLMINRGGYSGILLKTVQVEGFDYGLDLGSVIEFVAVEDARLSGQNKAAVHVGRTMASLRRLCTKGAVPALLCDGPGGQTVLVDSTLEGSGPFAVVRKEGVLYASQVRSVGFDAVVQSSGGKSPGDIETVSSGHVLHEFVYPETFSEPGDGKPMPRLAVEETPEFRPLRPNERFCGVKEFGGVGDGVTDDSRAIQKALDSGASEILFEPGCYLLNHPVHVPGSVRRINFLFADLASGPALSAMKGKGAFVVDGSSDEPLFIENLFAWEYFRGEHCFLEHASRRTLVLSDLHTQTLPFYINTVPGGKVFIENVASTAGVVPGIEGHGRIPFHFTGQQVWARQLNPERGEPMVLNDGGSLWVLGFKTEDAGPAFVTRNGGRTELLGGILTSGRKHSTAFVVENSQLRASAASNGFVSFACFGTVVRERESGPDFILPADRMPLRGFPENRGPQFNLPLYVSKQHNRD
jgi:hypothetical protein